MAAQEEWLDIEGYEGRYQVSNLGAIRSLPRKVDQVSRWGTLVKRTFQGKQLKPRPCTNGYLAICLGRGPQFLIHRLVAKAFVPGDTSLQVNHKNGIRNDNRACNLEWITCSDNHRHSYANLPRKKHIWTRPVVAVKGVTTKVFDSMLAFAKFLSVSQGSVSSAIRRGHKCRGWEVSYG